MKIGSLDNFKMSVWSTFLFLGLTISITFFFFSSGSRTPDWLCIPEPGNPLFFEVPALGTVLPLLFLFKRGFAFIGFEIDVCVRTVGSVGVLGGSILIAEIGSGSMVSGSLMETEDTEGRTGETNDTGVATVEIGTFVGAGAAILTARASFPSIPKSDGLSLKIKIKQ